MGDCDRLTTLESSEDAEALRLRSSEQLHSDDILECFNERIVSHTPLSIARGMPRRDIAGNYHRTAVVSGFLEFLLEPG